MSSVPDRIVGIRPNGFCNLFICLAQAPLFNYIQLALFRQRMLFDNCYSTIMYFNRCFLPTRCPSQGARVFLQTSRRPMPFTSPNGRPSIITLFCTAQPSFSSYPMIITENYQQPLRILCHKSNDSAARKDFHSEADRHQPHQQGWNKLWLPLCFAVASAEVTTPRL